MYGRSGRGPYRAVEDRGGVLGWTASEPVPNASRTKEREREEGAMNANVAIGLMATANAAGERLPGGCAFWPAALLDRSRPATKVFAKP